MSPGLGSAISIFSIGLVSGLVSGLLLGATAVVALQSLELLVDNRLLMDQLEKYIADGCYFSIKVEVPDIQISIFAVMFGVFSATFSVTVGIMIGLSTYTLETRREGGAATGKVLGVAGTMCLMGVTAT